MYLVYALMVALPFFTAAVTIVAVDNYLSSPVIRYEHRHYKPEMYANAVLIALVGTAATTALTFAAYFIALQPLIGN